MSELKSLVRHAIGDDATEVVSAFAKSFAYNLAQKPVSAIVQEVNHVAHSNLLPKLEFMAPQPVAAEGTAALKAQKTGEILAVVPWLMLGNKLLRQVDCLSDTGIAVSTLRAAIAGEAYGTLLQPVQSDKENFFAKKLKSGAEIAGGAALFVALQKGIGGETSVASGRQVFAQTDLSKFVKRDDLVWDLPRGGKVAQDANAARRAEYLDSGLVPVVKDSKIFDEFVGNSKWKLFQDRTDKQLLIDKSSGTIAKIFEHDELADQAAALKHIQADFGVTVPENVVLHTTEGKAALTMDYVEHKTGQDVFVLANSKPAFGFRNRQAEYLDLYKQGESLASRIHRSLDDKLFFADMHDENWGFTPKTIRTWRAGKTLNPQDLVVTDPVTGWLEDKPLYRH